MSRPDQPPRPILVLKKDLVPEGARLYQPVGRDEILSAQQIAQIRQGKKKGYTRGQLARKHGFSRKVINLVQNGHYRDWTEGDV